MQHITQAIGTLLLVGAALTACSSGGGQSTASSGGAATASTAPPSAVGSSDGGSGGTGGGASTSLNTTRFRTLRVNVTPLDGGVVSDNFEDFGSAVQQCGACSERYRLGTEVILTALAAPGFVFDQWQGPPCQGSTSPTCVLVIEQDARVTATFRR